MENGGAAEAGIFSSHIHRVTKLSRVYKNAWVDLLILNRIVRINIFAQKQTRYRY